LTAGVSTQRSAGQKATQVLIKHQYPKEDLAMTVLTRWEPFREFSTLQDRMNRLFR